MKAFMKGQTHTELKVLGNSAVFFPIAIQNFGKRSQLSIGTLGLRGHCLHRTNGLYAKTLKLMGTTRDLGWHFISYNVQSVKSIHQYFCFSRKELSISRFKRWYWFQMKAQVILHSIGVFTIFLILLYL